MQKLEDFEVVEISLVKEGAVLEEFLTLKAKTKEDNMIKETLVEKITKATEGDEPKKDDVIVEPKADEPKADDVIVEPKADEPKKDDEPKADEPKADEPKVDEVVKGLETQNAELIKKIKAFEAKEKEAIYKTKAEKLDNLNADGIGLVTILKEIDEKMDKEVAEKFDNLLVKLNALVEKSALLVEVGKSSISKVDSLEGIEAIAKARATKEKISYEKAYSEEIMKRKELYETK